MVKRTVLIFLLLLNTSLFGQDIRVKASTDTSSYKIGDYINYTLRIEYDKTIGIIPPLIKDSLKAADIIHLDTAVTKEENGRMVTIIKAVLSKYDSAVVNIPPIAIKYRTQRRDSPWLRRSAGSRPSPRRTEMRPAAPC